MNPFTIVIALITLCFITYCVGTLSYKLRIPSVLPALLAGLILGFLSRTLPYFYLPIDFISTLAVVAFILLVFDSTSRLKLSSKDTVAHHALFFITLFSILTFVAFALLLAKFFDLSPVASIILAATMLGVSAVFAQQLRISHHARALLLLEAHWTTPLALLLPLLLAIFAPPLPLIFVSDLTTFFFTTLIKITVSIATGVFIGVLLMKIIGHSNLVFSSPAIFAATFLSFGLAYLFGGYGVFAVATFGFFFANAFATANKQFFELTQPLFTYAGTLTVVLLGFIAHIPITTTFFTVSLLLFLLYYAIRFLTVHLSHRKHAFTHLEERILAFHVPASAAPCAVLLFLALFPPTSIPLVEVYTLFTLGFMLIVYSHILAFSTLKLYR